MAWLRPRGRTAADVEPVPASKKECRLHIPSDADGDAFRAGFGPLIRAAGYQMVNGAYPMAPPAFSPAMSH